eukprot:scaffold10571_cov154-Cylindrotheca_fusiformis.AAC.16
MAIFFVPVGILIIERYFGTLLKIEHVTDFYYEQNGVEPWKVDRGPSQRVGAPPDLLNLTSRSDVKCSHGLKKMTSFVQPAPRYLDSRKIPMIVHQAAESACLTMTFHRASMKWSELTHWSYYFHDSEAMDNLLRTPFPEFPYLNVVVENCVLLPSLKLMLWKFLVLWVYGGAVADINSYPDSFDSLTIDAMDDGFLLLDPKTNVLSSSLLALSPRHPLMYYAIQSAVRNILLVDDIGSMDPSIITGAAMLERAFLAFKDIQFELPSGEMSKIVQGTTKGCLGRSLRVASTEKDYLKQIFVSDEGMRKEFLKMGIETFIQPKKMGNCFHEINAGLGGTEVR